MARRRRNRTSEKRDHSSIANISLLHSPALRKPSLSPLSFFEDRREYFPDVYRPAAVIGARSNRRLVLSTAPNQNSSRKVVHKTNIWRGEKLGFAVPKKVALCIRRQSRREVIIAKRLQSRGASGRKHRNYWSMVKC